MRALRLFIVIVLVVLAACGSDNKKNSSGGGGSTTPASQDTSLGPGVTDTTVKIGASLIDFDCIKKFTDTIRTNQESYYQAFVDDINKHGGIAGRQVQLVMHSFCPIEGGQGAAACTKFTEDDKVFALIGLIFDPSGAAQACVAKQHKTPFITYLISHAIIDKAPPGLLLLAGATQERTDGVMVKLLKEQNTLAGKKVAVLAGAQNKKSVETALVPGLKSLGIEMGTTALLNTGTTGDTTSAQSQLDSVIERWKSEGVTAVFATGDEAAAKQFIEKVRAQMPTVTLLSDTYTVLLSAQEEQQAKKVPNPYEGLINAFGPTPQEYEKSENWKYCADVYKAETGKEASPPTAVIKSGSNTLDVYRSINDPCTLLTLVKTIGEKVGKYLNITNWVKAVDNLGPFRAPGQGEFASLHKGKYDMDDTFRLVQFDSSLGKSGDYKALSPLGNYPG